MRAALHTAFGGPETIELTELPKPEPGPGELLERVLATEISSGDARVRAFNVPAPFRIPARFMLGWPTPKKPLLGNTFAGRVEAVGPGVTRYNVGDRLFGESRNGTNAEYITLPETGGIAPIPGELTYTDAAALPFGLTTAMHFLTAARIQPGQSVLIIGASGCVGVYSVQLAKHMGAHVTAICSAANVELVRSLGADRVIDYTTEDYSRTGPYDVVMDAVGAAGFARIKPLLRRGGVYLNIVMETADMLAALNPFKGNFRIVGGSFDITAATMLAASDLVEQDAITPVIDRTYPLPQSRDAPASVDSKRKRGAVLLTI
jgi:NADPH:quinone reductase-like Zn-dependent oxidoreductase